MAFGASKKTTRFASFLLLAVMVLTFFSVFADFDTGHRSGSDETADSEGMLKLSWVSIIFSGQTIRNLNFNEFYGTLMREAVYTPAHFSQDPAKRSTDRSADISRFNPLAGAQVLALRIARFKAG